ncbi:DUF4118 domain-containing protein [Micromonospora sp. NPDC048905]|uniref:sensor histidine kinase n=1 Tax=Micromonospora sp. NPDC048905 TaxID=3155494 RepID=UPI00340DD2B5
MTRGRLRVYLGAAPGVGKTYAMLQEARRRADRGSDVVVGLIETHGREQTASLLDDLEIVPRQTITYRDAEFGELDIDAVLTRRPEVALVDELAHTNVPGSRHAKRWQDIQEILDAGIDVLSTVNIQHLESLNDVVQQVTGTAQRETVPDGVVRDAEQVELVDITPEALRARMSHGNIYQPDKIDAALSHYFRVGNLTALRELALLWLADKVDDQLDTYRAEHGIGETWGARERVVVALTGGPEGETLIRRASRIAARTPKGADLLAVHVTRSDGLAVSDPTHLARQQALVDSLGGTYHRVVGTDIPAALLDFARGVNATQIVLGVSRRGRFAQLLARGIGVSTAAQSGSVDVHLVTHEQVGRGRRLPHPITALSRRRRLAGFAVTVPGIPLLTGLLLVAGDQLSLASDMLLFLAGVVGVAVLGGWWPALLAALASSVVINYFFTPPLRTLDIARRENLLALVVFLLVAAAVSAVVDLAARRARDAARASSDAQILSTVAGSVLPGARPLTALLEQLRETFGLTSVTLLERTSHTPPAPGHQHDPRAWRVVVSAGDEQCATPADGDTSVGVEDDLSMVLRGRVLAAADRRLIEAFAAQAAVALRQERLTEEAGTIRPPAQVENLLDMSRLLTGTLGLSLVPVVLSGVVAQAAGELDEPAQRVRVRLPVNLPPVHADPALLKRVLVNLLANALRFSPADQPPSVSATENCARVDLRIVDQGPGVPQDQWTQMFRPFQHLDDRDNLGLGLALSRGLTKAMRGTLTPEQTPGGGLTMVLSLPTAEPSAEPDGS